MPEEEMIQTMLQGIQRGSEDFFRSFKLLPKDFEQDRNIPTLQKFSFVKQVYLDQLEHIRDSTYIDPYSMMPMNAYNINSGANDLSQYLTLHDLNRDSLIGIMTMAKLGEDAVEGEDDQDMNDVQSASMSVVGNPANLLVSQVDRYHRSYDTDGPALLEQIISNFQSGVERADPAISFGLLDMEPIDTLQENDENIQDEQYDDQLQVISMLEDPFTINQIVPMILNDVDESFNSLKNNKYTNQLDSSAVKSLQKRFMRQMDSILPYYVSRYISDNARDTPFVGVDEVLPGILQETQITEPYAKVAAQAIGRSLEDYDFQNNRLYTSIHQISPSDKLQKEYFPEWTDLIDQERAKHSKFKGYDLDLQADYDEMVDVDVQDSEVVDKKEINDPVFNRTTYSQAYYQYRAPTVGQKALDNTQSQKLREEHYQAGLIKDMTKLTSLMQTDFFRTKMTQIKDLGEDERELIANVMKRVSTEESIHNIIDMTKEAHPQVKEDQIPQMLQSGVQNPKFPLMLAKKQLVSVLGETEGVPFYNRIMQKIQNITTQQEQEKKLKELDLNKYIEYQDSRTIVQLAREHLNDKYDPTVKIWESGAADPALDYLDPSVRKIYLKRHPKRTNIDTEYVPGRILVDNYIYPLSTTTEIYNKLNRYSSTFKSVRASNFDVVMRQRDDSFQEQYVASKKPYTDDFYDINRFMNQNAVQAVMFQTAPLNDILRRSHQSKYSDFSKIEELDPNTSILFNEDDTIIHRFAKYKEESGIATENALNKLFTNGEMQYSIGAKIIAYDSLGVVMDDLPPYNSAVHKGVLASALLDKIASFTVSNPFVANSFKLSIVEDPKFMLPHYRFGNVLNTPKGIKAFADKIYSLYQQVKEASGIHPSIEERLEFTQSNQNFLKISKLLDEYMDENDLVRKQKLHIFHDQDVINAISQIDVKSMLKPKYEPAEYVMNNEQKGDQYYKRGMATLLNKAYTSSSFVDKNKRSTQAVRDETFVIDPYLESGPVAHQLSLNSMRAYYTKLFDSFISKGLIRSNESKQQNFLQDLTNNEIGQLKKKLNRFKMSPYNQEFNSMVENISNVLVLKKRKGKPNSEAAAVIDDVSQAMGQQVMQEEEKMEEDVRDVVQNVEESLMQIQEQNYGGFTKVSNQWKSQNYKLDPELNGTFPVYYIGRTIGNHAYTPQKLIDNLKNFVTNLDPGGAVGKAVEQGVQQMIKQGGYTNVSPQLLTMLYGTQLYRYAPAIVDQKKLDNDNANYTREVKDYGLRLAKRKNELSKYRLIDPESEQIAVQSIMEDIEQAQKFVQSELQQEEEKKQSQMNVDEGEIEISAFAEDQNISQLIQDTDNMQQQLQNELQSKTTITAIQQVYVDSSMEQDEKTQTIADIVKLQQNDILDSAIKQRNQVLEQIAMQTGIQVQGDDMVEQAYQQLDDLKEEVMMNQEIQEIHSINTFLQTGDEEQTRQSIMQQYDGLDKAQQIEALKQQLVQSNIEVHEQKKYVEEYQRLQQELQTLKTSIESIRQTKPDQSIQEIIKGQERDIEKLERIFLEEQEQVLNLEDIKTKTDINHYKISDLKTSIQFNRTKLEEMKSTLKDSQYLQKQELDLQKKYDEQIIQHSVLQKQIQEMLGDGSISSMKQSLTNKQKQIQETTLKVTQAQQEQKELLKLQNELQSHTNEITNLNTKLYTLQQNKGGDASDIKQQIQQSKEQYQNLVNSYNNQKASYGKVEQYITQLDKEQDTLRKQEQKLDYITKEYQSLASKYGLEGEEEEKHQTQLRDKMNQVRREQDVAKSEYNAQFSKVKRLRDMDETIGQIQFDISDAQKQKLLLDSYMLEASKSQDIADNMLLLNDQKVKLYVKEQQLIQSKQQLQQLVGAQNEIYKSNQAIEQSEALNQQLLKEVQDSKKKVDVLFTSQKQDINKLLQQLDQEEKLALYSKEPILQQIDIIKDENQMAVLIHKLPSLIVSAQQMQLQKARQTVQKTNELTTSLRQVEDLLKTTSRFTQDNVANQLNLKQKLQDVGIPSSDIDQILRDPSQAGTLLQYYVSQAKKKAQDIEKNSQVVTSLYNNIVVNAQEIVDTQQVFRQAEDQLRAVLINDFKQGEHYKNTLPTQTEATNIRVGRYESISKEITGRLEQQKQQSSQMQEQIVKLSDAYQKMVLNSQTTAFKLNILGIKLNNLDPAQFLPLQQDPNVGPFLRGALKGGDIQNPQVLENFGVNVDKIRAILAENLGQTEDATSKLHLLIQTLGKDFDQANKSVQQQRELIVKVQTDVENLNRNLVNKINIPQLGPTLQHATLQITQFTSGVEEKIAEIQNQSKSIQFIGEKVNELREYSDKLRERKQVVSTIVQDDAILKYIDIRQDVSNARSSKEYSAVLSKLQDKLYTMQAEYSKATPGKFQKLFDSYRDLSGQISQASARKRVIDLYQNKRNDLQNALNQFIQGGGVQLPQPHLNQNTLEIAIQADLTNLDKLVKKDYNMLTQDTKNLLDTYFSIKNQYSVDTIQSTIMSDLSKNYVMYNVLRVPEIKQVGQLYKSISDEAVKHKISLLYQLLQEEQITMDITKYNLDPIDLGQKKAELLERRQYLTKQLTEANSIVAQQSQNFADLLDVDSELTKNSAFSPITAKQLRDAFDSSKANNIKQSYDSLLDQMQTFANQFQVLDQSAVRSKQAEPLQHIAKQMKEYRSKVDDLNIQLKDITNQSKSSEIRAQIQKLSHKFIDRLSDTLKFDGPTYQKISSIKKSSEFINVQALMSHLILISHGPVIFDFDNQNQRQNAAMSVFDELSRTGVLDLLDKATLKRTTTDIFKELYKGVRKEVVQQLVDRGVKQLSNASWLDDKLFSSLMVGEVYGPNQIELQQMQLGKLSEYRQKQAGRQQEELQYVMNHFEALQSELLGYEIDGQEFKVPKEFSKEYTDVLAQQKPSGSVFFGAARVTKPISRGGDSIYGAALQFTSKHQVQDEIQSLRNDDIQGMQKALQERRGEVLSYQNRAQKHLQDHQAFDMNDLKPLYMTILRSDIKEEDQIMVYARNFLDNDDLNNLDNQQKMVLAIHILAQRQDIIPTMLASTRQKMANLLELEEYDIDKTNKLKRTYDWANGFVKQAGSINLFQQVVRGQQLKQQSQLDLKKKYDDIMNSQVGIGSDFMANEVVSMEQYVKTITQNNIDFLNGAEQDIERHLSKLSADEKLNGKMQSYEDKLQGSLLNMLNKAGLDQFTGREAPQMRMEQQRMMQNAARDNMMRMKRAEGNEEQDQQREQQKSNNQPKEIQVSNKAIEKGKGKLSQDDISFLKRVVVNTEEKQTLIMDEKTKQMRPLTNEEKMKLTKILINLMLLMYMQTVKDLSQEEQQQVRKELAQKFKKEGQEKLVSAVNKVAEKGFEK